VAPPIACDMTTGADSIPPASPVESREAIISTEYQCSGFEDTVTITETWWDAVDAAITVTYTEHGSDDGIFQRYWTGTAATYGTRNYQICIKVSKVGYNEGLGCNTLTGL